MDLGCERRGEASPFTHVAQPEHGGGGRGGSARTPTAARVVVPYTDLQPEVLWALQESGHDFEPVDVSDSDVAYWELLAALWRRGESFTIVEHDVVVTPELLDSFDVCDRPWCVAKYPYLRGLYWGLGCTRFAASLMRDFPDLMSAARWYDTPGHGPGHWCTLDAAITAQLHRRLRDWPHVHGTVEHLSDGLPAHGCRQA